MAISKTGSHLAKWARLKQKIQNIRRTVDDGIRGYFQLEEKMTKSL